MASVRAETPAPRSAWTVPSARRVCSSLMMIRPRASCSWRRPASQTLSLPSSCPVRALNGQESGVGGELVTRQAGIPLAADLAGGQQAPAVGQDPIGAFVQLEHGVKITWVGLEVAGVGGELAVAQELGLVGGRQGFRIDHGHFRRQVAEVALHYVQRHSGVQQAGGPGMPETVSAVEVHQGAGSVAHVQAAGKLIEHGAEPGGRVGPVAVAVGPRGQEQVLRRGDRRLAGCQELVGPLLLGADDRHDLLVDQDGVRRALDLGLLVAEPGGERRAGAAGHGREGRFR